MARTQHPSDTEPAVAGSGPWALWALVALALVAALVLLMLLV